jgi:transposase
MFLYDLTNTYYEGRMINSKIAKFGRSKEKRSDARIVVLAVVINREGFLKYSNIFEGNMADCKTLGPVVDSLSQQTSFSGRKPIVVIDAGIATDSNIAMLKTKATIICVYRAARSKTIMLTPKQRPCKLQIKRTSPLSY